MKMSWYTMAIVLSLNLLFAGSLFSESWTPPPEPDVAPIIGEIADNDSDGNLIDDDLVITPWDENDPNNEWIDIDGEEYVITDNGVMENVELVFREQITQKQIDAFLLLGGEIDYIYKAVSYGWHGRISSTVIDSLPQAMGPSLVSVEGIKQETAHMDIATHTGRVREIWKPGFAGSSEGFRGNSNTTIGIIDSGVDGQHIDLAGRWVYWEDQTGESDTPIDWNGHGSLVVSVAVGTGQAAGGKFFSPTLCSTDVQSLEGQGSDGFWPYPLAIPSTGSYFLSPVEDFQTTVEATALGLGGGSAALRWYRKSAEGGGGWQWRKSVGGTSGLTLSTSETLSNDYSYSLGLVNTGGQVKDYLISASYSNYQTGFDGYNSFSGVAPGCRWAAAKIEDKDGHATVGACKDATDSLSTYRRLHNIKIINVSRGASSPVTGLPIKHSTWRNKTNSAVRQGIVMVVSAGNSADDGDHAYGEDQDARMMSDPARAGLAITVGASNDRNALTDYSTYGFANPNVSEGEDYKPDLIAPGGSSSYSYIMSVDTGNADGALDDQKADDYASGEGTSLAAPFVSGAAALIIEALEENGVIWKFDSEELPLYVKMVLCATATETNELRENGRNNPILQRAQPGPKGFPAGKDPCEGYGIVNPDAAVEAVSLQLEFGTRMTSTLGDRTDNPTARRAWARKVSEPLYCISGITYNVKIRLDNPPTGDFDLYLYSAQPDKNGNPQLLYYSTETGKGKDEIIDVPSSIWCSGQELIGGEGPLPTDGLLPQVELIGDDGDRQPDGGIEPEVTEVASFFFFSPIVVVKRVSGYGEFSLIMESSDGLLQPQLVLIGDEGPLPSDGGIEPEVTELVEYDLDDQ